MKTMDEMDRSIKRRSESLGYKAALICLAIWSLYESWKTLSTGGTHNILPSMILTLVVCVQGFSEMLMKRNMTSGDEAYKEPNKILRAIIAIIVIVAITLAIGSYFLLKLS